jgi:hypothetical protein
MEKRIAQVGTIIRTSGEQLVSAVCGPKFSATASGVTLSRNLFIFLSQLHWESLQVGQIYQSLSDTTGSGTLYFQT